jgi:hypothetical protein
MQFVRADRRRPTRRQLATGGYADDAHCDDGSGASTASHHRHGSGETTTRTMAAAAVTRSLRPLWRLFDRRAKHQVLGRLHLRLCHRAEVQNDCRFAIAYILR